MSSKKMADIEMSTEDGNSTHERRALKVGGFKLLALSFSCLGIIYSDIGTSPLYVLSTIWPASGPVPPAEDVIGCISAIFWSFTLLPFLKYVIFALAFGTGEGEGGPFALFLQMFPRRSIHESQDDDRELTTYSTSDVKGHQAADKDRLGKLFKFRWTLQVVTLFATALTMADGILTPAVSVTSSVGGLAVVAPIVSHNIIPISIGFLVVLFFAQQIGTTKLSFLFAPVTFVWLLILGVSGIINTVSYPGIYRAFDPSRAVMYFVRTGNYDALAGVLLALTGCEAMFANLGQFNAASIRLSFITLVYPCLMFAYFGQGAKLISNGEVVIQNPFYLSIPGGSNGGLWWVTWIMGVLATLIASQAMITATFSLIHQLIGMKCFPSVKIHFTSRITAGQVYIPAINYLLMIGTIATVGGFGSSFALTLAYGFAVATVMICTTILISIQIPYVKHLPWALGVLFFLFFGFFDGLFWGAALRKVPHGAWFPLALGVILTIFMVLWTWGRELEDNFDKENKRNLSRIIFRRSPGGLNADAKKSGGDGITGPPAFRLVPLPEDDEPSILGLGETDTIPRIYPGTTDLSREDESALFIRGQNHELIELQKISTVAFFHKTTDGKGTPFAFNVFMRQVPALPRVVIFLSTTIVAIPHLSLEARYLITKVRSLDGFYGVTMRKGYLDRMTPEVNEIMDRIIALERGVGGDSLEFRLEEIQRARERTTHIVPSYNIVSRRPTNKVLAFLRTTLVEEIYGRLRTVFPDESSSPETAEETLKVGVVAVI